MEFGYTSKMGVREFVEVSGEGSDAKPDVVIIHSDDGYEEGNYEKIYVFKSDIPSLIAALQSAYNVTQGDSID